MSAETGNNPFVGLRPFETDESLLFFGREEQTLDLLNRLHQHRFVAVVGGSGSGKSSLIRAGLIPRLQAGYLVAEAAAWAIAVMKPGESPIYNLATALLAQPALTGSPLSATDFDKKIREEGFDAVLNFLEPMWATKTNLFLLVDQFEELFRFSLRGDDPVKNDEAKYFVNGILTLAAEKDKPIYVVTTMRSDFIGDCALIYGLPEAMNQSQYIVPRLARRELRITIEGPVKLYGGRINAALTSRLLNDVPLVNDELPLLQHVLMRMWDQEEMVQQNGEIDLNDYETVGGLEKALSNHADEALQGMTPEELRATKKIFQALTAVDENGRKIRRPARLSELQAITGTSPDQALLLINRFIEDKRSFLILSPLANSNDKLVDISHESLIRQWATLSGWVDEEAEASKLYLRLADTARLYQKQQGDLLAGNELQRVSEWFNSFQPNPQWAGRYSADGDYILGFLHESETQWQALLKERETQRRQKQQMRRSLMIAMVGIIVLLIGFGIWVYNNYKKNKKQLSLNYWTSSQSIREKKFLLTSLHFASEAAVLNSDPFVAKNLLADAERSWPQAALKAVFSFQGIVLSTAFHPDNLRIAIAGNDSTVRIINKETGDSAGPTLQHEAPVNTVEFSADGQQILTASADHTARLWNLASGKEALRLLHPRTVIKAGFMPDEKNVFTTCDDGTVRFWDAITGRQTDSLKHNVNAVTAAAFSPGGAWLLTGGADAKAILWNLATKKQTLFCEHNETVTAVCFSKDGTKVLTASRDSTAKLWDVATKAMLLTMPTNTNVIDAVFSPDNRWILTAGYDGYVRIWDAVTGVQTGAELKHEGAVNSLLFNFNGSELLTASSDKRMRLWQLPGMDTQKAETVFVHNGFANTAYFNKDGTKVVSASDDSTARIWDVANDTALSTLRHPDKVRAALYNTDGTIVATACDDNKVRLWNASTGKEEQSLDFTTPITALAFSPDGSLLIAAEENKQISLLSAANLALVDSFNYPVFVKSLVLSKNNASILLAGDKGMAAVLDRKTKKTKAVFPHANEVASAVFSPDEKKVLTACNDNAVRLWDLTSQTQIGPAMLHHGSAISATFSPDGRWIVSTGFDSTTRIWDVATLKPIGPGQSQKGGTTMAVFSPDGTRVLTAGRDGRVRLWPVGGDFDLPAGLFTLQAKALSGTALNFATGEAECLPINDWQSLKELYEKQGRDHYQQCRYKAYNVWSRFHAKEAKATNPK